MDFLIVKYLIHLIYLPFREKEMKWVSQWFQPTVTPLPLLTWFIQWKLAHSNFKRFINTNFSDKFSKKFPAKDFVQEHFFLLNSILLGILLKRHWQNRKVIGQYFSIWARFFPIENEFLPLGVPSSGYSLILVSLRPVCIL